MTATLLRLAAILVLILAGIMVAVQFNSNTWPFTEGVVGRSGWARESAGYGGSDEYLVRYDYTIDGKKYAGDRLSFSGNVTLVHVNKTFQDSVSNIQRTPHPGDTVRVHYAPWYPSLSVLVPGPSPTWWIWCVGAALIAILCFVFAHLSKHPVY